jgi:hypothetical protein
VILNIIKLKIFKKNYIKNEIIDIYSISENNRKYKTIYIDNYFQNITLFNNPEFNSNILIKNYFKGQLSKFNEIINKYYEIDKFYYKNAIVHLRFYSNDPLDNHNFEQKIYIDKLRKLVKEGKIEKVFLVSNDFEMIDWKEWSDLQLIKVDVPEHSNNALDLLAFISSFDYFFGSFSTFSWWGAYLSNSNAKIFFSGKCNNNKEERWFVSLCMPDWKLLF